MTVGARHIIYLHTLQRNEITSPQANATGQRITIVIRGTTFTFFNHCLKDTLMYWLNTQTTDVVI